MPWKDGYTVSDEVGLADADLHWPDGNRCCVLITVDLSVAVGPAGITAADMARPAAAFARHDGLAQLLAVLRRHGLHATFAVPAAMARVYGNRLRALIDEGHEVAAEGLRHEDVSTLSHDEERERLSLTTQILADTLGQRPDGWFSLPRQEDPFAGGTISPHTIDLLIEAGYTWFGNGLADDIPHYWVSDFASHRALLTLPYYYHFDDQFFLLFPRKGTGLENIDMLLRNWKGEFDAQYQRGRLFHMTLHPQGIGWCNRLQGLDDFLGYLRGLPGLWNPTGTACAEYWLETYPQRTHLRLEPSIWQDYPGSLS
jgi:peptidoglycan/xylan/chitin deacetylase (PgdA/CDA1 family)